MDVKSYYNIAFKGLGQGKHHFDYKVDHTFFARFEGSMVDDGEVDVNVVLEKQSSLLILWFTIKGYVTIQCDRCLDMYTQPIQTEQKVFVKFGEDSKDDGDDVVWVSTNDYQLNIAQLIYEFISLAMPIKHVHPEGPDGKTSCNPDMIEKMKKHVVREKGESHDARWDELKKLIDNK